MNLTVILHDNHVYGLTKKQASPTSPVGLKSNTTPRGAVLEALYPLTVTLGVQNASFVAQGVDWMPEQLYDIVRKAFHHRGFSFIRIIQRCPEFLPKMFEPWLHDPARTLVLTHANGLQPSAEVSRIYRNQREHDPLAIHRAREIASSEDPTPVGILYQDPGVPCYEDVRGLLAIDELNERGGVLGRPVEAVVEDGESDWPTFAAKAEKLITDDKVCALFGCWTSSSRKTVQPVLKKHDHLLFYPVQYEGLEESPNIVYTGAAPNQQIIPGTLWALNGLGKAVYLVGSDYLFPRAANLIIRDLVKANHGCVVAERYRPLGDADFSAVIAEIRALQPDVVLNTINGDSNTHFFRIWQLIGLLRQGRFENLFDRIDLRVAHATKHVLLQPRSFNERAIGWPHFLIFWGFVLHATCFNWSLVRGLFPFLPVPYPDELKVVSLFLELFAILVLVSLGVAVVRRLFFAPPHLHLSLDANLILGLIGLLMLSTLFGNAFRLVGEGGHTSAWMPLGSALSKAFAGMTPESAHGWAHAMWWLHIGGVLFFLVYLP